MHAAKLILNATVIGVLNLAALVIGIGLVAGWLVLFRKFNA